MFGWLTNAVHDAVVTGFRRALITLSEQARESQVPLIIEERQKSLAGPEQENGQAKPKAVKGR